jgi:glycosyltransferase involved in cell wall biosynthesis
MPDTPQISVIIPTYQRRTSLERALRALCRPSLFPPVVATAIAGVDEIVSFDRTGCLVSPAHPAALARAIKAILRDPIHARQLGLVAQAHARSNFDTKNMVGQVTGAYAELLRHGRGRHAGA